MFKEQFRALRAKLEFRIDLKKFKSVAITSAIAGEGKTKSCMTLAASLAATGRKKVLLIDTDLRKSDLAREMDIPTHPGLGEFLTGKDTFQNILRKSADPGLYVIPGGENMYSPSDILTGGKFRSFLQEIRDKFDFILLDTPPVLPVADTLTLQGQVDGFLFLFRARYTPHSLFRQAVEEIGEKNIIGVIINGVEPKRQKYYMRYYGKYYQAGGKAGVTS